MCGTTLNKKINQILSSGDIFWYMYSTLKYHSHVQNSNFKFYTLLIYKVHM